MQIFFTLFCIARHKFVIERTLMYFDMKEME